MQVPLFCTLQESISYRKRIRGKRQFRLETEWHSLWNAITRERNAHLSKSTSFEGIINKRDAPLWDVSSSLPSLAIFSQYTNEDYADIGMPSLADYKRTLAGMWVGNEKQTVPFARTPYEWAARVSGAVFRGGATGSGVCSNTNLRLKLCALSKECNYSPLDARLTSWNCRHKISNNGKIHVIDPETAAYPLVPGDASRSNYLTMQDQSHWKYYVYLDGNVGASRLGELAEYMFLVLMPKSSLPQVPLRRLLENGVHFVELAEDLSDLFSTIKWLQENDSKAKEISRNLYRLLTPRLTKQVMEENLGNLIRHSIQGSTTDDVKSTVFKIFTEMRAAIYFIVDENGLQTMIPFANENYKNDWKKTNKLTFEDGNISNFLQKAQKVCGYENILENTESWWSNGSLICNIMPYGVWGESMLPELCCMLDGASKHLYKNCSKTIVLNTD
jgi:hypothetical protein